MRLSVRVRMMKMALAPIAIMATIIPIIPFSNLQALHPPPHSRSKGCGLVSTQECHCGGKKHRQRRHLMVRVGVWGVVWVRDLGVESFRFENDVQVANTKANTK